MEANVQTSHKPNREWEILKDSLFEPAARETALVRREPVLPLYNNTAPKSQAQFHTGSDSLSHWIINLIAFCVIHLAVPLVNAIANFISRLPTMLELTITSLENLIQQLIDSPKPLVHALAGIIDRIPSMVGDTIESFTHVVTSIVTLAKNIIDNFARASVQDSFAVLNAIVSLVKFLAVCFFVYLAYVTLLGFVGWLVGGADALLQSLASAVHSAS